MAEPLSFRAVGGWMIPRIVASGGNFIDVEATMRKITDFDSWVTEWEKLAARYEKMAVEAEAKGNLATAREMYFYAFRYYSEAQRIMFEESEEKKNKLRRIMDVYRKVALLSDYPIERVEIPFRKTTIPGYLHLPKGNEPFPCCIVLQGMHTTKEELHVWGRYATDRNMALLIIDAPGQGETRYFKGMYLKIPDLIEATSRSIDYLNERTEIDADQVGVLGLCLGAHYAFRAASVEKRLKFCVAMLAVAGFYGVDLKIIPEWVLNMIRFFTGEEKSDKLPFSELSLDYLEGEVTCPVYILHSEHDTWLPTSHAQRFYDLARGPKKLLFIKDKPVFPGSAFTHYIPLFEQLHWVIPLAFDWAKEQVSKK